MARSVKFDHEALHTFAAAPPRPRLAKIKFGIGAGPLP
jgi:hypothetical protein